MLCYPPATIRHPILLVVVVSLLLCTAAAALGCISAGPQAMPSISETLSDCEDLSQLTIGSVFTFSAPWTTILLNNITSSKNFYMNSATGALLGTIIFQNSTYMPTLNTMSIIHLESSQISNFRLELRDVNFTMLNSQASVVKIDNCKFASNVTILISGGTFSQINNVAPLTTSHIVWLGGSPASSYPLPDTFELIVKGATFNFRYENPGDPPKAWTFRLAVPVNGKLEIDNVSSSTVGVIPVFADFYANSDATNSNDFTFAMTNTNIDIKDAGDGSQTPAETIFVNVQPTCQRLAFILENVTLTQTSGTQVAFIGIGGSGSVANSTFRFFNLNITIRNTSSVTSFFSLGQSIQDSTIDVERSNITLKTDQSVVINGFRFAGASKNVSVSVIDSEFLLQGSHTYFFNAKEFRGCSAKILRSSFSLRSTNLVYWMLFAFPLEFSTILLEQVNTDLYGFAQLVKLMTFAGIQSSNVTIHGGTHKAYSRHSVYFMWFTLSVNDTEINVMDVSSVMEGIGVGTTISIDSSPWHGNSTLLVQNSFFNATVSGASTNLKVRNSPMISASIMFSQVQCFSSSADDSAATFWHENSTIANSNISVKDSSFWVDVQGGTGKIANNWLVTDTNIDQAVIVFDNVTAFAASNTSGEVRMCANLHFNVLNSPSANWFSTQLSIHRSNFSLGPECRNAVVSIVSGFFRASIFINKHSLELLAFTFSESSQIFETAQTFVGLVGVAVCNSMVGNATFLWSGSSFIASVPAQSETVAIYFGRNVIRNVSRFTIYNSTLESSTTSASAGRISNIEFEDGELQDSTIEVIDSTLKTARGWMNTNILFAAPLTAVSALIRGSNFFSGASTCHNIAFSTGNGASSSYPVVNTNISIDNTTLASESTNMIVYSSAVNGSFFTIENSKIIVNSRSGTLTALYFRSSKSGASYINIFVLVKASDILLSSSESGSLSSALWISNGIVSYNSHFTVDSCNVTLSMLNSQTKAFLLAASIYNQSSFAMKHSSINMEGRSQPQTAISIEQGIWANNSQFLLQNTTLSVISIEDSTAIDLSQVRMMSGANVLVDEVECEVATQLSGKHARCMKAGSFTLTGNEDKELASKIKVRKSTFKVHPRCAGLGRALELDNGTVTGTASIILEQLHCTVASQQAGYGFNFYELVFQSGATLVVEQSNLTASAINTVNPDASLANVHLKNVQFLQASSMSFIGSNAVVTGDDSPQPRTPRNLVLDNVSLSGVSTLNFTNSTFIAKDGYNTAVNIDVKSCNVSTGSRVIFESSTLNVSSQRQSHGQSDTVNVLLNGTQVTSGSKVSLFGLVVQANAKLQCYNILDVRNTYSDDSFLEIVSMEAFAQSTNQGAVSLFFLNLLAGNSTVLVDQSKFTTNSAINSFGNIVLATINTTNTQFILSHSQFNSVNLAIVNLGIYTSTFDMASIFRLQNVSLTIQSVLGGYNIYFLSSKFQHQSQFIFHDSVATVKTESTAQNILFSQMSIVESVLLLDNVVMTATSSVRGAMNIVFMFSPANNSNLTFHNLTLSSTGITTSYNMQLQTFRSAASTITVSESSFLVSSLINASADSSTASVYIASSTFSEFTSVVFVRTLMNATCPMSVLSTSRNLWLQTIEVNQSQFFILKMNLYAGNGGSPRNVQFSTWLIIGPQASVTIEDTNATVQGGSMDYANLVLASVDFDSATVVLNRVTLEVNGGSRPLYALATNLVLDSVNFTRSSSFGMTSVHGTITMPGIQSSENVVLLSVNINPNSSILIDSSMFVTRMRGAGPVMSNLRLSDGTTFTTSILSIKNTSFFLIDEAPAGVEVTAKTIAFNNVTALESTNISVVDCVIGRMTEVLLDPAVFSLENFTSFTFDSQLVVSETTVALAVTKGVKLLDIDPTSTVKTGTQFSMSNVSVNVIVNSLSAPASPLVMLSAFQSASSFHIVDCVWKCQGIFCPNWISSSTLEASALLKISNLSVTSFLPNLLPDSSSDALGNATCELKGFSYNSQLITKRALPGVCKQETPSFSQTLTTSQQPPATLTLEPTVTILPTALSTDAPTTPPPTNALTATPPPTTVVPTTVPAPTTTSPPVSPQPTSSSSACTNSTYSNMMAAAIGSEESNFCNIFTSLFVDGVQAQLIPVVENSGSVGGGLYGTTPYVWKNTAAEALCVVVVAQPGTNTTIQTVKSLRDFQRRGVRVSYTTSGMWPLAILNGNDNDEDDGDAAAQKSFLLGLSLPYPGALLTERTTSATQFSGSVSLKYDAFGVMTKKEFRSVFPVEYSSSSARLSELALVEVDFDAACFSPCLQSIITSVATQNQFSLKLLIPLEVEEIIPQAVTKVASTATVVSGTISSALGQPSIALQGTRMSLLRDAVMCSYSHYEPLDLIINPTTLCIGSPHGCYYRGSVVGNIIIFFGFILLVLLIAGCRCLYHFCCVSRYEPKNRNDDSKLSSSVPAAVVRVTFWTSLLDLRFPGVLVVPVSLGLGGTVACSVALLAHSIDKTDVFLGILGLIMSLGVSGVIIYQLTKGMRCVFVKRSTEEDGKGQQLQQPEARSCLVSFYLYLFDASDSHWQLAEDTEDTVSGEGISNSGASTSKSSCHMIRSAKEWKKAWLLLFLDYKFSWFMGLETVFSVLGSIAGGFRYTTRAYCIALLAVMIFLQLILVIVAVFGRPGRDRFTNIFLHVLYISAFLADLLAFIAILVNDEHLDQVSTYVVSVAELCTSLRIFIDLTFVSHWIVSKLKLRRRQSGNREAATIDGTRREFSYGVAADDLELQLLANKRTAMVDKKKAADNQLQLEQLLEDDEEIEEDSDDDLLGILNQPTKKAKKPRVHDASKEEREKLQAELDRKILGEPSPDAKSGKLLHSHDRQEGGEDQLDISDL